MSKRTAKKIQRRVKRQTKERLHRLQQDEKLKFLWEQFLGVPDKDKTYYPTHDPTVSNHRRVIGQRIMSGRLKPKEDKNEST